MIDPFQDLARAKARRQRVYLNALTVGLVLLAIAALVAFVVAGSRIVQMGVIQ